MAAPGRCIVAGLSGVACDSGVMMAGRHVGDHVLPGPRGGRSPREYG